MAVTLLPPAEAEQIWPVLSPATRWAIAELVEARCAQTVPVLYRPAEDWPLYAADSCLYAEDSQALQLRVGAYPPAPVCHAAPLGALLAPASGRVELYLRQQGVALVCALLSGQAWPLGPRTPGTL